MDLEAGEQRIRTAADAATIAEVAVEGARGAGRDALSYAVPEAWRERIVPGQLVWVPLRRRLTLGVVLALRDGVPEFPLKPIHAPAEPPFTLDAERLAAARWLARETASTAFAALAPFLPPVVTHRVADRLRLAATAIDPDGLDVTRSQRRLLALLAERSEVSLAEAQKALGSSLRTVIAKLVARGLVERVSQVEHRVPPPRTVRFVRLVKADGVAVARAPRQRAVVEYLTQRARLAPVGDDGLVPLGEVLARTGTDHAAVHALAAKGVIEATTLPAPVRTPKESGTAPALTPAQAAAWRRIEQALATRDTTPFLLHGVTGSGKTEIYLRAVAWCLRHDRAALVLVPEIALASQVVRRFTARFPGQVAVLHSGLPDSDRYATWQGIAGGEYRVVVGPRSALFAPARDLGLIVLDEEHEGAYKQESEPRYHARALAERLGRQLGAVVLLGSATPAIETFRRSEAGESRRLELPARVGPDLGQRDGDRTRGALDLPAVEVVDMRLELHRGNTSLFSERLAEVLEETLRRREQAILFLNRRGMATIVLCRACGAALLCRYCDIPLVYHQDRELLLCHRCNASEPPRHVCPGCGGVLNYFGAGTQRVEQEVKRLLPDARVLRWDQDSIRREGGHDRMLRRVERREVDVVVGTQMIAKGLDLPLVTAIGVIHADTMLHLPDFRAAERTFQLLTQVAGRAGRRAPGSQVVVQSYTPAHYAIQAAARHDYAAFYAEELDFRRAHGFPPFGRLVRYLYRDADEARCAAEAEEMARHLAWHARLRGAAMELLGPTPAFASRVRGQYQWQIVLRTPDLDPLLDGLPTRPGWTVDVDPQSML